MDQEKINEEYERLHCLYKQIDDNKAELINELLYNKLIDKLTDITKEKERKNAKNRSFRLFAEIFKRQPVVIQEWDEKVWALTVDRVVVNTNGTLTFEFYSNKKIIIEL